MIENQGGKQVTTLVESGNTCLISSSTKWVIDSGATDHMTGIWDIVEEANGDATHSEVECSALTDMASSSENKPRRSGWISSEDEADIMDQDDEDSGSERSRSFREHRRSHYDEYRRIKELRRQGSSLEEASDDEIEDLEKRDGKRNTSSSLTPAVKGIDIVEGSTNDSK